MGDGASGSIEVLRRLGWTQKEIGEAMGLSRQRVQEVLPEIPDSVKAAKTQLAKAHQIDEVAEAYNMPLIQLHARPGGKRRPGTPVPEGKHAVSLLGEGRDSPLWCENPPRG